jgi:hypothetical protein
MENPGCQGGNNGKSRLPGLPSSRLKPVLLGAFICRTGFSREGASGNNEKSSVSGPAASLLMPLP